MFLKLHSVPAFVKLASVEKRSRRYGEEKSYALEIDLGSSSVFVRWPSPLWGSVSSFVKVRDWSLTSYSFMGRACSLMVSTEYSTLKCCFPTRGEWRKVSHKILLSAFLLWVLEEFFIGLFCYWYHSSWLLFIVSDSLGLVFWDCWIPFLLVRQRVCWNLANMLCIYSSLSIT